MSGNTGVLKTTVASTNKQQPAVDKHPASNGVSLNSGKQLPVAEDQSAESQIKVLEEQEKATTAKSSISQVFSPNRDELAAIPYILDGDLSMYAPDKMAIRQKLRNSPAVLTE